jgi:hypothetical protein
MLLVVMEAFLPYVSTIGGKQIQLRNVVLFEIEPLFIS